jgi:hypothetical protein
MSLRISRPKLILLVFLPLKYLFNNTHTELSAITTLVR